LPNVKKTKHPTKGAKKKKQDGRTQVLAKGEYFKKGGSLRE
jgi:hypothetical protein